MSGAARDAEALSMDLTELLSEIVRALGIDTDGLVIGNILLAAEAKLSSPQADEQVDDAPMARLAVARAKRVRDLLVLSQWELLTDTLDRLCKATETAGWTDPVAKGAACQSLRDVRTAVLDGDICTAKRKAAAEWGSCDLVENRIDLAPAGNRLARQQGPESRNDLLTALDLIRRIPDRIPGI